MQNEGIALIEKWKNQSNYISNLFHERKYQEASLPMQQFTNNFIQLLFILNKEDWDDETDGVYKLKEFTYKPLNIEERMQFVQAHLHQYHSYIHLKELYKEVEKLYAKVEILEKDKGHIDKT